MTEFKSGNLVRLHEGVMVGSPLHSGIGLIVGSLSSSGYTRTYYKVLIGETIFAFRADEIELL